MRVAIIRFAVVTALAGCGSAPPAVPDRDLPPLDPAGSSSLAALAGSGGGADAIPDHRCIAEGTYAVDVDLHDAKISQGDTGMSDTQWCASMLVAVPSQMMRSMTVRYDSSGALDVEWPTGHFAEFRVTSPCDLAISSPPMPAQLTFAAAGGSATGTTSYAVGTQHEGDTCSASGAKVTLTAAAAP